MSGTLLDLATDMDTLADKIGGIASAVSKEAASLILSDLTKVTPADTGAALSNWIVSLDAPIIANLPPYVPSPRGRMINGRWTHTVDPSITTGANQPPTLEAGLAIIAAKKPGQAIYITNSQPYIQRLDEGSSDQAPAGFVDRAIILARSVMDNVRRLL